MPSRIQNKTNSDSHGRHAASAASASEAVQEWISRYHAALYRFAAGYTRDVGIAEDIVQEVFIRAWQTYQKRQKPLAAAWFYQVTHRLCIDQHRRSTREREGRDRMTGPVERPDATWPETTLDIAAVRRVMNQLSRADQLCLWLFYYGDWPIRDIAEELDVTENAVKLRLVRARNRFRKLWEEGES